jgi:hypothetical protein
VKQRERLEDQGVNWRLIRGVYGKKRYITCRPIGKFYTLLVATLSSTLILFL